MSVGNRILPRKHKASEAMVAQFRDLPVANISDSMGRLFAGGARLRPMHASGVLAGPALTVRSRPGDNLMLHKAIDLAEPGDVIVADAGGDVTNSLIGELMLVHAAKRGVAGFVLYGAARDADAIRNINLPTYALGVTHRGPYKHGPGEINVGIAIDGMVIEPGDLIVGDSDGVLSVPYGDLDRVLEASLKKREAEQRQMAQIEAGTNDRSWVDKALRDSGCEIVTT